MKSAWQLTMRTLGCMKVILLPLMISGITMGSSIASPILQTENNISEESTLPKKENPKEENEKLHQSLTGKSTMEALMILNEILEKLAETLSEGKLSPSTQPLEK